MPRKPKKNPARQFLNQRKYRPRKNMGRLAFFDAKTWMYQPLRFWKKGDK